jgi:hypothetical protein
MAGVRMPEFVFDRKVPVLRVIPQRRNDRKYAEYDDELDRVIKAAYIILAFGITIVVLFFAVTSLSGIPEEYEKTRNLVGVFSFLGWCMLWYTGVTIHTHHLGGQELITRVGDRHTALCNKQRRCQQEYEQAKADYDRCYTAELEAFDHENGISHTEIFEDDVYTLKRKWRSPVTGAVFVEFREIEKPPLETV